MNDVILRLSRLTDRAQRRGQENLSLWALLDDICDPTLNSKIKNMIKEANAKIDPLKVHRHKRIAHFDLHVALQSPDVNLPSIDNQSVDEALWAVGQVFEQLEEGYTGSSTEQLWVPVETVPDIEGLLYYLESGWSQEQSRRDEVLAGRNRQPAQD